MSLLLCCLFLNKVICVSCGDSSDLASKGPYVIQDSVLTYYNYEFNFDKPLTDRGGTCDSNCTFHRIYNNVTCTCFGTVDNSKTPMKCSDVSDNKLGNGVLFNFTAPATSGYYACVYVYTGDEPMYTINNQNSLPVIVMFYNKPTVQTTESSISWGSVFCIIVLALVVVYFAAGIPIMFFGFKKSGVEMLPFYSLLAFAASLVLDGVRFLFSQCRNCLSNCLGGSKSTFHGEYARIPESTK